MKYELVLDGELDVSEMSETHQEKPEMRLKSIALPDGRHKLTITFISIFTKTKKPIKVHSVNHVIIDSESQKFTIEVSNTELINNLALVILEIQKSVRLECINRMPELLSRYSIKSLSDYKELAKILIHSSIG